MRVEKYCAQDLSAASDDLCLCDELDPDEILRVNPSAMPERVFESCAILACHIVFLEHAASESGLMMSKECTSIGI